MATEEDEACSCGEAPRPVRFARSWGDWLPTPLPTPPTPSAESDGVDDDGDTM